MEANDIFLCPSKAIDVNARFSIIIPSWNNLAFLKNCIGSIRKNSSFSHQIIVFLNEGKKDEKEWLDAKELDYAWSSKNIGVCYALNGVRSLIRTNYLLFLNDDMYVCPQWDLHLWEEIEKQKSNRFFLSATMIQPVDVGDKGIIVKNYGKTLADFEEEKLLREFPSLKMQDWSGATWPPNLVHINTWDLVGGYSIEYSPGMYSDPDFSMKLWHAGVRVFKGTGKSRIYHFTQVTTKKIKKNKGSNTFLKKWGITARTFGKHYLKRGETYTGPCQDPSGFAFRMDVLRSRIKNILLLFFG